jgi:hypothetical protein
LDGGVEAMKISHTPFINSVPGWSAINVVVNWQAGLK